MNYINIHKVVLFTTDGYLKQKNTVSSNYMIGICMSAFIITLFDSVYEAPVSTSQQLGNQ